MQKTQKSRIAGILCLIAIPVLSMGLGYVLFCVAAAWKIPFRCTMVTTDGYAHVTCKDTSLLDGEELYVVCFVGYDRIRDGVSDVKVRARLIEAGDNDYPLPAGEKICVMRIGSVRADDLQGKTTEEISALIDWRYSASIWNLCGDSEEAERSLYTECERAPFRLGDRTRGLADALGSGADTEEAYVMRACRYVYEIPYDFEAQERSDGDMFRQQRERFDTDAFLAKNSGVCYDKACLLAALLRCRQIPCRIVFGRLGNRAQGHVWNEAYVGGAWQCLDATHFEGYPPEEKSYTAESFE